MANRGLAPVDPTSPIGQVRLLLGDTDAADLQTDASTGAQSGEYRYFSDDEITGLLSLYAGSAKRTAARALRTIAASQTLLLKAFTSADLAVDMPSAAKELRLMADALTAEAAYDEELAGTGPGNVFMTGVTGGEAGYLTPRDWDKWADQYERDNWPLHPPISLT